MPSIRDEIRISRFTQQWSFPWANTTKQAADAAVQSMYSQDASPKSQLQLRREAARLQYEPVESISQDFCIRQGRVVQQKYTPNRQ